MEKLDLQKLIDESTGFIFLPMGDYDIGTVNVHKSIVIMGPSFISCVLHGNIICTAANVSMSGFQLKGSGVGISFPTNFNCVVSNCIITGYDIAIDIAIGQMWQISGCYIVNNTWGIQIKNNQNGDCGDHTIEKCTFDGNGIAAVHYQSSGGLRCMNNKILGHDYGFLGEIGAPDAVTSDFLFIGNSVENQKKMGVVMRTEGGAFDNVVIVANQFALNAPGIWVDNMRRVIVQSNIMNCGGKTKIDITRCTEVINKDNV